ncbi:eukaryotic translation initiation factor 4B3 [Ziziphus jujuba]|uniref:Eukaryotic translation initiation factor 4B3 n=2 Tax=Ziziphus jujuba TaxID=326968 RepID=A0A6P4AFU3_ZIZJJ|nr:eukaryotic translation initiation factor 4B3 [Ziziphus jujuba]KAH7518464.1 hypothetical protein FEM48_Zijuj09G0174300 [Ziziphus jujuba var. spinosa]
MAATMSPWGKPGAWALDSEEHEAELQQLKEKEAAEPLPDFPSLAAAATTKPKKKKGQTITLAEFTTYGGAKPAAANNIEPKGLTHEDRLKLPTGPRERSAEELDRNRLGGGFRGYGSNGSYDRNNRYSNGDESSNSRWGSSRGSERNGGGGFGRDANRESGPSRADEIDNWAAAKKSPTRNGFERKDRGGFFDSQSKADESDSWVSNKSFVPSEGRRFGSSGGGFERERRVSFTSNGGGADSDNWGKKREESYGVTTVNGTESGRPRLNLQPRTLPVSDGGSQGSATVVVAKTKGSNPFGDARPREEVLAEKGQDWKKIDEQLESKVKHTNDKAADGGSSFGKRSFGIGNGRAGSSSDSAEKTWRKPDGSDARPTSAEKIENGNSEEIENGNSEEIENGNADKVEDVNEN